MCTFQLRYLLLYSLVSVASAQRDATPRFEVVSLKRAPAQYPPPKNGGKHIQGLRVRFHYMPLLSIIAAAYDVEGYQISGPSWLRSEFYDIEATLPDGTAATAVPGMLRSLLAERLRLVTREERREFSVYALVVSEGGVKLQRAAPPVELPDEQVQATRSKQFDRGGVSYDSARTGASHLSIDDKVVHFEAARMDIPTLVYWLRPFVERPIVDETSLVGHYVIRLDLPTQARRALLRGGTSGDVRAESGAVGDTASEPGPSVSSSLSALGLKLESRKILQRCVIVVTIDKIPADN